MGVGDGKQESRRKLRRVWRGFVSQIFWNLSSRRSEGVNRVKYFEKRNGEPKEAIYLRSYRKCLTCVYGYFCWMWCMDADCNQQKEKSFDQFVVKAQDRVHTSKTNESGDRGCGFE